MDRGRPVIRSNIAPASLKGADGDEVVDVHGQVIRSNIAPASLKEHLGFLGGHPQSRHPEQHCSGLIEGGSGEGCEAACVGVIRSNIAPASLKGFESRDPGAGQRVIRSNIAPASLKGGGSAGICSPGLHVIRSNIAPASLKAPIPRPAKLPLLRHPEQHCSGLIEGHACRALLSAERLGHPEQHCSGLIEGAVARRARDTAPAVIRSNIAPASLKASPWSPRNRRACMSSGATLLRPH